MIKIDFKDNKKNKKEKKKYLNAFNSEQEKFLMERFKKDWLVIQKITNRDRQLEKIRELGLSTGKILLGLAAIGGILAIAAVAPNMFVVLDRLNKQLGYFSKKDLDSCRPTYQKNSYFKFKKQEDSYRVELTDRGKKLFLKSFAKNFRIKETKKWDGKWWLVTFDIPRKHNSCRDLFREKLKMIGMNQLQESVFVSRYNCHEEVLFWASLYNISDFVHIAKAEFLTNVDFLNF